MESKRQREVALDRALIEITGSQEWRRIEDSYFGR
jgi:hypothetical protein